MSAHRGIARWRRAFHLVAAIHGEYGERVQIHLTARYLAAFLTTRSTGNADA